MPDTLEPIIRENPFFQGLEQHHIQFIVGCAKNVQFEEGAVIAREGNPIEQFYIVREGLIALEVTIPQRGSVIVQTVDSGDVVGWSWLFPPYRWKFGARALAATRALAFDGNCLRAKCDKDHDLGYELLKRFTRVVTERLEATRLQLLDLYSTNN